MRWHWPCIHHWRLLSVEEQTNKAHGSYMQWQQPACNASFYYICRGDRRRSQGSCMWRQQPTFTATEVEFADIPAAGRAFCDSDYGQLCMFLWLYWYATIVEKVTSITCNTFNRYGSVAPWVSSGGICRVDIPAAGCAFCDSDLKAVMHVSLAFWIYHDRWKGHHNYMQHIQSIWQRSAMGQLRWNLSSRHTGGRLRILWQWPTGRYACFAGLLDMPRPLKRSPQLHATHSIDMAA